MTTIQICEDLCDSSGFRGDLYFRGLNTSPLVPLHECSQGSEVSQGFSANNEIITRLQVGRNQDILPTGTTGHSGNKSLLC